MAEIRNVDLFLASSIKEFKEERRDIAAFVNELGGLYRDRMTLRCVLSDYQTTEAIPGGKQTLFDDQILQSQLFYLLIGKKLGKISRHEYEVAWQARCEQGSPGVFPWFLELPDEERDDSVRDFLRAFREDEDGPQYSATFAHIDTVKLSIMLALQRGGWLDRVEAKDGQISTQGTPVMPTENIPVFAKHQDLAQVRQREEAVKKELACPPLFEAGEELAVWQLRMEQEQESLRTEQHRLEGELLNLFAAVNQLGTDGTPVTARGREARRLVEAGDAEGALRLLREADREGEAAQTEAMLAPGQMRVRALLDEDRLRIRLLRAKPISKETVAELRGVFERAARLAERHQVEWDLLYDYVSFLYEEKDYRTAIPIGERLRGYYERDDAPLSDLARLDNLLGLLYAANRDFTQAEARYQAALRSFRTLAAEDSTVYEAAVAMTYNNLGVLLKENGEPSEAQKFFSEALAIYRRLAKTYPATYEPDVAMICNNLGVVMSKGDRVGAWANYDKALEIYRRLATAYPGTYEPFLAGTCNNLGTFLKDNGDPVGAQKYYGEALEIYRRLAVENPAAYEPYEAGIYNNLGNLLKNHNQNELNMARQYYMRALKICRRLAIKHPTAYEPDVAMTCYNYGRLEIQIGSPKTAKPLFEEAERLWRKTPRTADRAARAAQMILRCDNLLSQRN